MFQNKDCKKLVLFITGKEKKIGTESRNSVIVSYSINPTMFDRVSKPGPSGHQTANHKAKIFELKEKATDGHVTVRGSF